MAKKIITGKFDGKKVKINLAKIEKGNRKRTDWCRNNIDRVFTAVPYKSSVGTVYAFKEDTTVPKWLFFEEDLIEVKGE